MTEKKNDRNCTQADSAVFMAFRRAYPAFGIAGGKPVLPKRKIKMQHKDKGSANGNNGMLAVMLPGGRPYTEPQ